MIALNSVTETSPTDSSLITVVPATLHDYGEYVYEDRLYSLYTTSTQSVLNQIEVQIIARDLVQHKNKDFVTGYWVGIGINKDLLTDAKLYKGYGTPVDTDLGEEILPDGEQEVDGKLYNTFYFDKKSSKNKDNTAYVVVDTNGTHYHFSIDLSEITVVEPEEELEELRWSDLSYEEIVDDYLFGIDLTDTAGNPLPKRLFIHYLNSAVEYFENLLDITISDLDVEKESHDYIRNDYENWGYMQLSHNPVKEVKGLRLMYGNRPSIDIPLDWIKLNKLTGQINLFPAAGSASNLIIGQTGMLFGFQNYWDYAPELWEVDYEAGIDKNDKTMPLDLLKEAVYKRASCGILNVWGDLIIGAGIASQSVSLDGVSQSIGTTQSAMFGGASARVDNYTKDINETLLPALRQKFGGLRMIVL